jgi:hypothetical protein
LLAALIEKWPAHLPNPETDGPRMMFNLKTILHESMTFSDSTASEGLQLSDIITNAFRRALMGRLQRPSYDRLGELMRGLDTPPVVLHVLGEFAPKTLHTPQYEEAISVIESRAKLAGA